MNRQFFRHVKTALRLLLPTRSQWRYARAVRRGAFLDREFYFASNPRLPLLCRIFPERHYVLRGEPLGLCPSPQFSPRAYIYLNPDVAGSGLAPLAHYMASGHGERRLGRDLPLGQMPGGAGELVLPQITAADGVHPPAPYAIVVHVFYPEIWPEIAAQIAAQRFEFDLFVTFTNEIACPEDLAAQIHRDFGKARIWAMPNHGRDIFPFLHLLAAGVLRPYQAVCKLHTKKSPHRDDGDTWRQDLIRGILDEPTRTANRLAAFVADPMAGLWAADGHVCSGTQWWGNNRARTLALLAKTGDRFVPDALRFAAGSIYWIKPALLDRLAALQLTAADFEPEMGQVDGTTAHALERGLGLLAQQAGLTLLQSADLTAL